MSHKFYAKTKGTKQGDFKGGSQRNTWKGFSECLLVDYTVESPRDPLSGQASGKRRHSALTITKEWDPASPQYWQALVNNEVLTSIELDYVFTTAEGKEDIYYTIKLTNATVSKHHLFTPEQSSGEATYEQEEISFTFQKIELTHKPGNTMASDDWLV